MNKLYLLCITGMLIISSCKKDNDPAPETNTTTGTTSTTGTTPEPGEQTEQVIEIRTAFGNMYMWLHKETPLHRQNFLSLADSGFFDSTTFHRCVSNFVIQGGDPNTKDDDPNNDGSGGPGYTIPAEIKSSIRHIKGAVGAARDNNPEKASSGSQFYIVLSEAQTRTLNGNYTVFGQVIKGMEVAEMIVKQPQNPSNNRPVEDIRMDVNVLKKTIQQLRDEYNFVP